VNNAMVLAKGQALFTKHSFHDWDKAIITTISDHGAHRLYYIDAHQRFYVLGLAAFYYFSTQQELPSWLGVMVSNIRINYVGCLTLVSAKAKHLQLQASMQFGIQEISWLEILLDLKRNGELFSRSLDEEVMKEIPEHHSKLKRFLDGHTWADRVDETTLRRVEAVQEEQRCAGPPIPLDWLRDHSLLLQGKTKHSNKKNQEHCDAIEQELAVSRILNELLMVAANNDNTSLDGQAKLKDAVKDNRLNKESRLKMIMTSKKYIAGIQAAKQNSGPRSLAHRNLYMKACNDTLA
jgi:hypothetical protein